MPKTNNLKAALAVLFLIVFTAAVTGCGGEKEVDQYDFTLPGLEGEEVTLSSYTGKVILIKFWTTACIYCLEDLVRLEALQKDYPGIEIFAINIGGQREAVKSFVESAGFTFPVLLDEDGEVAGKYRVLGVPTTVLFDKEGNIVYNKPGALPLKSMKELLESEL
ncbi:MAG: TlpA family protein disulfide reductase [Firmicutes bacterium]|nr:TlpA family protein disulfide reductase [Bacillota bacterium]